MSFVPHVEGTASIRTPASEFLSRFRGRVDAGLLSGQPHPRSRYIVTRAAADRLDVSAADWWTAVNVGLNEVELHASGTGQVRFTIRYWRWATYGIAFSACLGFALAAVFLALDLRSYVESNRAFMIPGLSVDQNVVVAWTMVAFWGLVWPWLLIALHKRPLRRLMKRLIAEVDTGAPTIGTTRASRGVQAR